MRGAMREKNQTRAMPREHQGGRRRPSPPPPRAFITGRASADLVSSARVSVFSLRARFETSGRDHTFYKLPLCRPKVGAFKLYSKLKSACSPTHGYHGTPALFPLPNNHRHGYHGYHGIREPGTGNLSPNMHANLCACLALCGLAAADLLPRQTPAPTTTAASAPEVTAITGCHFHGSQMYVSRWAARTLQERKQRADAKG